MPKTDQGVTTKRYSVIPRTLIFIVYKNNVLLIKGSPQKRLWAGKYNGLGGHIEPGENIYAAAQRELEEETGLRASDLILCGIISIDVEPKKGVIMFVFKGSYRSGVLNESKEGNLEWIQVNEIHRYPLVEDLEILLPRVLNFQPGSQPIIAHSHYDNKGKLQIKFVN